jgi:thioredoxin-dependent peroxiredoxin
MNKLIRVGDAAPDFALEAPDGRTIRLSDYRGQKNVVLFFYPRDETPGCTVEACTFRDSHEAFARAGAEVIGISADDGASHVRFATRHRLPMLLLSDPAGLVRARYGVRGALGLFPGRVTFLIDREGIVRHVTDSQLRVRSHVHESLARLREMGG